MVAPVSSRSSTSNTSPARWGLLDRVEGLLRTQGVEAEEANRQDEHDEEDPPAQALAEGVARSRRDTSHPTSSPTASR